MTLKDALKRERSLFADNRRQRIGGFILIALIPLLYAYIFIGSIADPFRHMGELPVGVLNSDSGFDWKESHLVLGDEIVKQMLEKKNFHYHTFSSDADARRALSRGEVYFVIEFPENFSEHALRGEASNPAQVKLIIDEGLGYSSTLFGRRLGAELVQRVNHQLNRRRWEIVFSETEHAGKGLADLKRGVTRLESGAKQLSLGGTEIAKNLGVLKRGLSELESGAKALKEGAEQFRVQSGKVPLIGGRLGAGAGQIENGAERIEAGLGRARDGGARLEEGMGLLQMGAMELRAGLQLILSRLPRSVSSLPGDADGLADSVGLVKESLIDDFSYGQTFAPYFMALSLWLGGVLTTFFFFLRRIPESYRTLSKRDLILAKLALPASLVLLQSFLVGVLLPRFLGFQVHSSFGIVLISLQAALIFLLIIFSLVLIFRDAGRLIALILFVFQIASAGGAFPVETSASLFRSASPFLPIANIVRALRAASLGTFEGIWFPFVAKAWLAALLFFALGLWCSRWKVVPDASYSLAPDAD